MYSWSKVKLAAASWPSRSLPKVTVAVVFPYLYSQKMFSSIASQFKLKKLFKFIYLRLNRLGLNIKVKIALLSSPSLLIESRLAVISNEINWQIVGDRLLLVEHRYFGSIEQLLEHPSPLSILPSSH
jgi:hypothetical protein